MEYRRETKGRDEREDEREDEERERERESGAEGRKLWRRGV
jgi:hypothetical protein